MRVKIPHKKTFVLYSNTIDKRLDNLSRQRRIYKSLPRKKKKEYKILRRVHTMNKPLLFGMRYGMSKEAIRSTLFKNKVNES